MEKQETVPTTFQGKTYNIPKVLYDKWVDILEKFQKENPCPWKVETK